MSIYDYSRVPERIKSLRIEMGLTLAELSEATEIDMSKLARAEAGGLRFRITDLMKIAWALDCSLGSLIQSNPIRERITMHVCGTGTADMTQIHKQFVELLELDEYLERHGIS